MDNLTIDNLKIDTDRDGMDIDCCKNVRVSNCTVNSPWDDAIVPKSSFALGYNRPCRTSTSPTATSPAAGSWAACWTAPGSAGAGGGGTGRIKCGTESNGGFINISISNCVFEGCQGLALETVDGALLEDITVTNITMRDIISCPIYLRLGARLRGPKGAAGTDQSTVVGTLKRVLISDIVCHNTASRYGSNITGIPGYPVEDLKISDVYVQCAAEALPIRSRSMVPENENAYPEPGMLGTAARLRLLLPPPQPAGDEPRRGRARRARRPPCHLSGRRAPRGLLRHHRAQHAARLLLQQVHRHARADEPCRAGFHHAVNQLLLRLAC